MRKPMALSFNLILLQPFDQWHHLIRELAAGKPLIQSAIRGKLKVSILAQIKTKPETFPR